MITYTYKIKISKKCEQSMPFTYKSLENTTTNPLKEKNFVGCFPKVSEDLLTKFTVEFPMFHVHMLD